MRDRIKKCGLLILLASVFVFAHLFSITSAAEKRVYDEAHLLNTNQITQLESEIAKLRSQIQMDIVVLTIKDAKGKSTQKYADDFYDQNNFGTGKDKDGALLLIDMENRVVYISTTGKMIDYLTDKRISEILDGLHKELSNQSYQGAATRFLKDVENNVKKGIPAGQHRYNTETGEVTKHRYLSANQFIIFGLIALGLSYFCCNAVRKSYQIRYTTYQYPVNEKSELNLTRQDDIFLYETEESQIITPKSESSSNRSSTHSSSSGQIHGGGGRKF